MMQHARREANRPQGLRILRIPAAAALLQAVLSFPPVVGADEAQDFKAAIVMRCYHAVGEFGSQLIDTCVKEDLAASEALKSYPPESAVLIQSCTDRLIGDGFARVKACVDQGVKSGSQR
jgi:hypothetical protein